MPEFVEVDGTEMVEFNTFDRCDRCQAQALAPSRKEGHAMLLWCNHHKKKHESALLDSGWEVMEDTEAIRRLVKTGYVTV